MWLGCEVGFSVRATGSPEEFEAGKGHELDLEPGSLGLQGGITGRSRTRGWSRDSGQRGTAAQLPGAPTPSRDRAEKENIMEDGTPPPCSGLPAPPSGRRPPSPEACKQGRVLLPAVGEKGGLQLPTSESSQGSGVQAAIGPAWQAGQRHPCFPKAAALAATIGVLPSS